MKVIELKKILNELADDVEVEVASNETEAMLLQGEFIDRWIYLKAP